MAQPVLEFFGQAPNLLIIQTSDQFNGTAQTGTPEIGSGVTTFPVQAGGGLVNFHKRPIMISQIKFVDSGGSAIVSIKHPEVATAIQIGELNSTNKIINTPFLLPYGSYLTVTSSGGSGIKKIIITAKEALPTDGCL